MASVKRARGKRSVAISDRSGFKVPYTSLKTTWEGLRVEPEEYESKHPQLTPPRNVVDATALFNPRPDNDPEDVHFFVGYNYNIFLDPIDRPPVGIAGFGAVASQSSLVIEQEKVIATGLAGTGAIGTVSIDIFIDVRPSGAAGTGAVGTEIPRASVIETGVAGTGAIGIEIPESIINETGVAGTGTTGTEVISLRVEQQGIAGTGAIGTPTLKASINETGVAGTGAVGTESLESELNATGVAGTGAVHILGESDGSSVTVLVTGISGIGRAGSVGNELLVSEIIESGVAGTGAVATAEATTAVAWGQGAWGVGTWGI